LTKGIDLVGTAMGSMLDSDEPSLVEPDETPEQTAARFRNLTAAAFDGIAISQEGKIVDVNEQLAQLLGCSRSELIGEDVLSFVAPEARERVATAMRSGLGEAYEHPAVRKDGSLLQVEARGKVIRLGGREARVTVLRDVSRRRRVEDAVRKIVEATAVAGVEFFGALVRGVAGALGVRHALVGELVNHDAAPAGASGARVRTLALWAGDRLVDNTEYAAQGTPCEHVLAHGLCFFPERVREQFPEDELLEALGVNAYLGVPLFAVSGQPLGVLAAMHDRPMDHGELAKAVFTIFAGRAAAEMERLRADAALRSSEASLRATIDGAPHVAIQWYDPEGRVLLWNHASEKIFGWPSAEALGKTLDALILSADNNRGFIDRVAAILHSSQPSGPTEYRFRRRDGSEGHCLSTTFRISDGADGPRVACMDVDISERRRVEGQRTELEEQLRHAQQLESLGTFAGGIAHDFNNILAAIFAYCELADASADNPDEAREHLAELHKAAARARDLVQQVLLFSRRQAQARAPVGLQQLLQEALAFLRSTLPSTIEIQASIDWQAPLVLASPIQMYQVILNLSMNASQAMGEAPGRLELGVDAVEFSTQTAAPAPELGPGRYVRLRVSDTGHGIDAETLKRIFEPFFTTKGVGKGTGLGLSQVYGMARQASGTARIRSATGTGTTVSIFLRITDGEDARDTVRPAADDAGTAERACILIVDDDPGVRQFLADSLESFGYAVLQAADGKAGLAILDTARPDAMIVDYAMPGMTGAEVAKLAKSRMPDLPILFASGYAETSALSALTDTALVLRKPFRVSELHIAIRRALQR
jgi:PAS domain S-box-containing protein